MDTKKLRQKILDLAIRGKLVPQDPNDEPASVLLERIRVEKQRLVKEGKIKAPKGGDKCHYEKVEGPFEIPEGWVWVKLSDMAFFSGGKTPSMAEKSYWKNGRHLWVTSKDMKCDVIEDTQIKLSDKGIEEMSMLPTGTILMVNRSGILRRTLPLAILGRDATINQDLKSISLYITEMNNFVFWELRALEKKILLEYKKDGTTVDNINFDKFVDILLPVPPLKEQQRIVTEIIKWLSLVDSIEASEEVLSQSISKTKAKILDKAISGKLVPQDPSDEPAIELLKRIKPAFVPCDNSHYENLPQGWTMCKLEDILEYEQPQAYIVESTEYSDNFKTPVLTPGKSFILGYTNEQFGIYSGPFPVIIFDDFTTASKYVNFPFKVKSSAMKILHPAKEIDIKYVEYFMSITKLVGDTHKRYWISEYSKIEIPVPPLKEQHRITEMVDNLFGKLDTLLAETES